MNTNSIFQAVQDKFNIIEVARDLGIRIRKIGYTYRADSIDSSGRGENALCLYADTNTWYDFMLNIGGDITSLVANVKFNGDIKQALHYLMPGSETHVIEREIKAHRDFADIIDAANKRLFDASKPSCVNALKYLHDRGITDETINQLKIGVRSENGASPELRIIFPYWDEAGKRILYYSSRRFDWRGTGEDEHSPKYKKASLQEYPFLHNAPMGLDTLKRRKDDTLIITEGVFDMLAFYQEGYSVLSPNGSGFGKMWQEVLEKVRDFKRVILAFDSDQAGQDFTYTAAKTLAQHRIPFFCTNLLTKDVAEHYETAHSLTAVINSVISGYKWLLNYIVPKTPFEELSVGEKDKAMNKCKDFIEEIAPFTKSSDVHQLLIALRSYFPKEWVSGLFDYSRKGPSQTDVADKIYLNHSVVYNPRTGFYVYRDPAQYATEKGIWKKVDDEVIMGYIKNIYGRFATGSKLSSTLQLLESDERIYSDIPVKEFNSLPLISFTNGTLHIDLDRLELKLLPHRKDDYATYQIPYAYDPDAKCPTWEKFMRDITAASDDSAVMQEFAGYSMLPDCRYQKALMLKGGGSNGKSVFFNIISTILGGDNRDGGYVSNSEPAKWSKDFKLMSLFNSWVNISTDIEQDLRGAEGAFKKISAGEYVEDSYKYKDTVRFKPRTKLMVSCNYFPTVNDTSDGFMRRWLIVELPVRFVEKCKLTQRSTDREIDPDLESKLLKEIVGIINWMLKGLFRLLKQKGFTHTASQDRLIAEFRAVNNPLYSFVADNAPMFEGSDQGRIVENTKMLDAYLEWTGRNIVQPMPSNRFFGCIKSVFRNLGYVCSEEKNQWLFFRL